MNVSSAFTRVAKISQSLFAGTANVSITPVGGAVEMLSAIAYREKVEWRDDGDGGDRYQVITRKVQLPPGSTSIPIGSEFTVNSLTYTVEHADARPASGAQILLGVRFAAATVSRDGYYI